MIEKTIVSMEGLLRNEDIENFSDVLNGQLQLLMWKRDVMRELDSKIRKKMKEADEISKDVAKADEFEGNIFIMISRAESTKERLAPAKINAETRVPFANNMKAKLPKIELIEFHGDLHKFSAFMETFESTVHTNRTLSDIDKFTYLRSMLKGAAAATIAGLTLTAENYEEARELLKRRYGDKQVLTAHLMDGLLQLEPVLRADDVAQLRVVYDSLETHLRNLKSLGIDSKQFGPVMIPVILAKLPAEIRLEITRKATGELWDFDQVLESLLFEVSAREKCLLNKTSAEYDDPPDIGYTASALSASSSSRSPSKQVRWQTPADNHPTDRSQHQNFDRRNQNFDRRNQNYENRGQQSYFERQKYSPQQNFDRRNQNYENRSSQQHFDQRKQNYESHTPQQRFDRRNQNQESRRYECIFCKTSNHSTMECKAVKDIDKRKDILRSETRCFNCLKRNHRSPDCYSQGCRKCGRFGHHQVICHEQKENASNKSTVSVARSEDSPVLLQTAVATAVNGAANRRAAVRCLFDGGAQKSYVERSLIEELRLPIHDKRAFIVSGFGGHEHSLHDNDVVKIQLATSNPRETIEIIAHVVDTVCAPITQQYVTEAARKYPHLRGLQLAETSNEASLHINMLIGADQYWKVASGETITGNDGPAAIKTRLGWILSGPVGGINIHNEKAASHMSTHHVLLINNQRANANVNDALDATVSKFWDLETSGIITNADSNVYDEFKNSIEYDGEKYTVRLPWKNEEVEMSDNYHLAACRLAGTMRKLKRDRPALEEYDRIITDQLKNGVIESCTIEPMPDENAMSMKQHYLSHHPIIRADKETTKLRIVYDASARNRESPSLNDCLFKGPKLNEMILDVLLRFRLHRVVFISDIQQAFLRVQVNQIDRDFLRFLWIDDVDSDAPLLRAYRFRTLVFGLTSSPFLLNATLRHHLSKYVEAQPEMIAKILRSLYVDDLNSGGDTTEEAFELFKTAKSMLSKGGFLLHKFHSNDDELQQRVGMESQRSHDHTKIQEDQSSFTQATYGEADAKLKVLGVTWNNVADSFCYNYARVADLLRNKVSTKRELLSAFTTFYDPLGMTSPVLLKLKIAFQDACKQNVGWDDELPPQIQADVKQWTDGIDAASSVEIPRFVLPKAGITAVQLVGFSDGSSTAYGANVYMKVNYENGDVKTTLLVSKTRVAPLKKQSIPRIELLGCLIMSRLISNVLKSIQDDVYVEDVVLFSDSATALWWIKSGANEYKQYVHHRVKEIASLFDASAWNYVDSKNNPSDISSRGGSLAELKTLWWHGPAFLNYDRDKWPKLKDWPKPKEDLKSSKSLTTSMVNALHESESNIMNVMDIERFSTLTKLLRVTARVLNLIEKWRKRRPSIDIGADDMKRAETMWIKAVQHREAKQHSFAKTQLNLKLFHDENGLLRCGGRIEHSELNYDAKFPIYLPSDSPLTNMIVNRSHHDVRHMGATATLVQLRSRYWVVRGRRTVKKILKQCRICIKHEGKPYAQPQQAPLPEFRVKGSEAFANIGIDYAGPLYVYDIYTKSELHKCYILLVTCALTRAVHLELVPDQGSSALIRAFKRLFARRGQAALICSDNAKTFKSKEVDYFATQLLIKWRYNLPASPWWGGFFERMVGMTKRVLRKMLGNARLTFEEMNTVLIEVEGVLNNRPLTYIADDNEPITPAHLMHGRRTMNNYTEQEEVDDLTDIEMSNRTKYITKLIDNCWSRWKNEYMTELRERNAVPGKSGGIEPRVGDVVLIQNENKQKSRMKWKTGRIEKLIVGNDGITRGAEIVMPNRTKLSRPVQKLYPLEVKREEELDEIENNAEPITNDDNADIQEDVPPIQPTEVKQRRMAAKMADLIRRMTKQQ